MLIEVRTLDKKSNPLKVSKGDTLPIQHTVEPNTRVEIYMDGQKQNGQSAAGSPTKKLTKVGKNLVLSEEDKPLVELVNFYGEAGVTLVGDYWSAADTQLTAVSEGLAFQEAAPLETAALVAAGPSTLTWVLGGVAAVGLGGGGGGGGGGSTTTTTSTTPSASTTIAAALAVIKDYSGSNTVPNLNHYKAAGVTGVTDGNLSAINSAISPLVSGVTDTTAKVQSVVDAYKAVLAAADQTDNNATNPTQAQYTTLGVKGVDTPAAEKLLGDVIDIKSNGDVNNVSQVQDLADAVAAVLRGAKGDASAPVTVKQLTALGITGVADSNISAIQAVIKNTNDVNQVDTQSKLQSIVEKMASSLAIIQNFTTAQTPTPTPAPSRIDYSNIGVSGVTDGVNGNLNAINSSIDYLGVNETNNYTKVQNVVNIYKAILDSANGKDNSKDTNPAFTLPTAEQYVAIGVASFNNLDAGQMKARAALLGSAIDLKSMGGVDTLGEIQKLAETVDKVMKLAANNLPSTQTITQLELETLGLKYLTVDNLDDFFAQVEKTDNAGTQIGTLGNLQYFVDPNGPAFVHAATDVIKDGRIVINFNEKTSGPVYTPRVDDLNKFTFSISQDDGRNFDVDSNTGVVTFKSPPNYDIPSDGYDAQDPSRNSYYFNITATDTAGNKTDQFISLYVKDVVDGGAARLEMGADLGQLIKPYQVDGKWYYHWDKNNNGIADLGDATTMDDLATIFKYNTNGDLNKNTGGYVNNEFRFAILNGYKVALPTLGNGLPNYYNGSNYDLVNPDSKNKTESFHNDLFAIWDAYNGDKTIAFNSADPASYQNGTPDGWVQAMYWASTNRDISKNFHDTLDFSNGRTYVVLNTDDHDPFDRNRKIYAAFEVL